MAGIAKNVSITCFHDEHRQVFNAVHREKVKKLACLPDTTMDLTF